MKCIRYLSQPEVIERLPNDEAKKLVESGKAHFTTKSAWKSYERNTDNKRRAERQRRRRRR